MLSKTSNGSRRAVLLIVGLVRRGKYCSSDNEELGVDSRLEEGCDKMRCAEQARICGDIAESLTSVWKVTGTLWVCSSAFTPDFSVEPHKLPTPRVSHRPGSLDSSFQHESDRYKIVFEGFRA